MTITVSQKGMITSSVRREMTIYADKAIDYMWVMMQRSEPVLPDSRDGWFIEFAPNIKIAQLLVKILCERAQWYGLHIETEIIGSGRTYHRVKYRRVSKD